ncbi:MAG: hypothetical protein ABEJ26_08460 [Halosimplex sp.]
MTADDAEASTVGEVGGERTVSVLGTEIVLEDEFVSFPWRAGMARAPGAYLAVFVLTALVAAVGGFGSGSLPRRFSLLGLVVFNVHNIPVTTGAVPRLLKPVADPVVAVPGIGRLLRGLFTYGIGHGAPLDHVAGILAGQTDQIGHVSFVELQRRRGTDVPTIVYYLLPPVVLTGAGYEFADSHWDDAVTETFADVARFGVAVAAGYVVVMLVASVLFSAVVGSLAGAVTVVADRYLLMVFAFAYPALFATLGAGLVYRERNDG